MNGALNDSAGTVPCSDISTWAGATTNGVSSATISRGLSDEEVVTFAGISASSLTTVLRGQGGTTAQAHASGATIELTSQVTDFDEANAHIADTTLDHHTQYVKVNGSRTTTGLTLTSGTGGSTTLALDNTGGGAGRSLDVKWNGTRAFSVENNGVPKASTGLDVTGSPSGYIDELRFTSTGAPAVGISSLATGAGQISFDGRGVGNTISWIWRNGTNAANTRMTLSAAGLLTPTALAVSGATTAAAPGANGGATALTANPAAYWVVNINGTDYKIPFYNA